jgi:carboxypeptidase D
MMPYVEYWSEMLYLNQTFLQSMHKLSDQCGFTEYYEKYFKFPPPQVPFPVLPDPYQDPLASCRIWDTLIDAATEVNPCFNLYHISETCPHP